VLGVYRERVLSLTQSSAPSHCNIITKNYCIGAVSFLPPSLLPLFALVLSFHFLSISVDTRQACREVNHISRHGAGMSRGESADTGQACRGVSDRQGEATRAANAPSIRRHVAGMSRIIFDQNEDVRDIAVGSLCKQVQAISQISPTPLRKCFG
jgi:hypothetical protein